MEINSEERLYLCKGLEYLISVKEYEMNEISKRTEEDYETEKKMEKLFVNGFSLEQSIRRDLQKASDELKQIKELYTKINRLENNLLVVPHYIKLHLNASKS